jgi:hypothetical protein
VSLQESKAYAIYINSAGRYASDHYQGSTWERGCVPMTNSGYTHWIYSNWITPGYYFQHWIYKESHCFAWDPKDYFNLYVSI